MLSVTINPSASPRSQRRGPGQTASIRTGSVSKAP